LSGDDLTLGLEDGTSFTVDVTTLGVDENKFVSSGALSGSNLILTMSDSTEVTIDATNMINGSSGLASNSGWNISYGTNANDAVGTSTNDSTVSGQLPFYFGQALEQGSEFKWNFQSNSGSNLIMGIWDGAEVATAYNGGANTASNWGTMFAYSGGFTDGSNSTLLTTNSGAKYVVTNGDAMSIRFGNDGHLTLVDLSGTNEVAVAKTTIPLVVTSFNMQMYTWINGVLPNGIISNSDFLWDIKHDYANTEDGVLNGVLAHTILERTLALSVGEQYMIPLDKQGAGETFGLDYTGASTGVITAEDDLDKSFKYQTNESIIADLNWAHNTAASGYFIAGGSIPSYRVGGVQTEIGLLSLRYMTDNTLEIWSETNNELIATSVVHPDGSDINLHYGVNGNTNYSDLPTITKQVIGQGTQPSANFAPIVANQTATVVEGEVLNFQVVTSYNIVNHFAESDAPSWMEMNQGSGVLSGTAPAFTGGAADTIVVNCKAGNAIGGHVDFTVTVTVASYATTNTKSLRFPNSSSAYLNGNAANVTALQRAANGTGATDAWSISMWVKPSTSTNSQQLFYYGGDDLVNEGRIDIVQFQGNNLLFRYGKNNNNINFIGVSNFPTNQWNHILITYNGGDTLTANGGATAFTMSINGANGVSQIQAQGGGFSNDIPADNYRIGRFDGATTNQYLIDGIINQVAIWNTNQDANIATIYNSGAVQNLSLLADAPSHYYEIESSVTTITDIEGSANLTGYNFAATDLVTDTP
jgi:hypothetical protein